MVNIAECIERGELEAEIGAVISSRSTVAEVEAAKKLGLEASVVRVKDHRDVDEFSGEIIRRLDEAGVDLIVQCGWLCYWKIPGQYENRVMNIHPALLPAFGGKGMWGHHVHEAVLATGCKISGCTVHFVTNEYDAGPIIVQRSCPVLETDTAESLAGRVFEQECRAYPEAIKLFGENRLAVQGGKVIVS